ncbi:MAG: adenine-specific DNA-methyltransferase [Desulfobacteraceae bacterium Eth-SRB1]|nr:MAG: adenine-specific DNA-methyltransferase [Desulfobacteraceae bacterium Eth-SRB1]
MDGKSLDIKQDKIEKLKEVMPEAFTEGIIDWEKLKATLGEDIEFKNERYVLNWAGKSDAFKVLQAPTTATLAPDRNESIDFDNTGNVFIEGENLEVLKALQRSYFGKIKMIYIDPPYNTGNDNFIYPDRFSETKEEYLGRIGDKDEAGYMTREGLFRKNSRDSGHYHSNWLSMMYPRLFLARNLLKDDGVIFVSIDDNEVHNLRLLMNEVFGEENFIDCIIWKKRYGGGAKEKFLVSLHEYALVYAKNLAKLPEIFMPLPQKSIERYYKLKDKNYGLRGAYRTHPLEATKSMGERKNLVYPIPAPDGTEVMPRRQWLWGKERTQKALKSGGLEFIKGKDGKWTVHTKQYLKNENGEIRKDKAFSIVDDVYTQHGTNEIIDLFGNAQIFSFPKPTAFINFLINIGINDKTGIILDFFPGSCTTAHAVFDLNKQDNGARKFICAQLPEKCDEKSEAYKADYKTIADIGKERIRRVIKKIKESENGKLPFEKTKQDLGFKVFKLQASNFKIWRGDNIKDGRQLEKQMQIHLDSIKKDATEENMLFELLLKSGRNLNSKIENANDYYRINDGEMIIALSRIDEKIVDSILEDKPQVFITLDRLFKNNDQLKTNTLLQMKDAGIEFKVV